MRVRAAAGLVFAALLIGCAPKAPKGIDQATLDDAVGNAIGDPTTCVILAEKGTGKVVYQYGSNLNCSSQIPICKAAGVTTPKDLIKAAAGGETRTASCAIENGGAAYAIGPVQTQKPQYQTLVYVAAMTGKRYLPGIEMATRLDGAFKRSGL